MKAAAAAAVLGMALAPAARADQGDAGTGAEAPGISLEEAVERAASAGPRAEVARWRVAEARARLWGARTRFLPDVQLTGGALWWDAPIEAEILGPDACASLEPAFQDVCGQLLSGLADEPIVIREQRTQQVGAEARLPLSGQWTVASGVRAAAAEKRAVEAELDEAGARGAVDAAAAWLAALRAEQMAEVADSGVRVLEAHRDRAAALHEAGLLAREDLLRVEVALARARADLARAEAGVEAARTALAVAVGADAVRLRPLPPEGWLDGPPPPVELPDERVEELVRRRPDVVALGARVGAARALRDLRRSELLPQVAALAGWKRTWGAGTFAADQESYVGLGLQWDAWGWGRRIAAVDEAAARVHQAEAGLEATVRAAALEARRALADARVAGRVWEARRAAVEQAREHLDLTRARFEVGDVASADLLEAEALWARALAEEVSARMEALDAIARAQAALGLPVRPWEGLPAE